MSRDLVYSLHGTKAMHAKLRLLSLNQSWVLARAFLSFDKNPAVNPVIIKVKSGSHAKCTTISNAMFYIVFVDKRLNYYYGEHAYV